MHFYIVSSGFREKKHKGGGGVQFQILKNPGRSIDLNYSDFRKKNSGIHFREKKHKGGGGGAIRNPKKIQV